MDTRPVTATSLDFFDEALKSVGDDRLAAIARIEFQSQVAEMQVQITEKDLQLAQKGQEIERLTHQLSTNNRQVSSLQNQIVKKNKEHGALHSTMSAQRKYVFVLNVSKERQAKQIKEMDQLRAQVAEQEEQLDAIVKNHANELKRLNTKKEIEIERAIEDVHLMYDDRIEYFVDQIDKLDYSQRQLLPKLEKSISFRNKKVKALEARLLEKDEKLAGLVSELRTAETLERETRASYERGINRLKFDHSCSLQEFSTKLEQALSDKTHLQKELAEQTGALEEEKEKAARFYSRSVECEKRSVGLMKNAAKQEQQLRNAAQRERHMAEQERQMTELKAQLLAKEDLLTEHNLKISKLRADLLEKGKLLLVQRNRLVEQGKKLASVTESLKDAQILGKLQASSGEMISKAEHQKIMASRDLCWRKTCEQREIVWKKKWAANKEENRIAVDRQIRTREDKEKELMAKIHDLRDVYIRNQEKQQKEQREKEKKEMSKKRQRDEELDEEEQEPTEELPKEKWYKPETSSQNNN